MTAERTDKMTHSPALTPIKILLVVQPSQAVKKLNRAIKPRAAMMKQVNVHSDDRPYQHTLDPPSATLKSPKIG